MQNLDSTRLDLPHLVVLDALLKLGSVTAVAQSLNLTQPNVSYALKKLRDVFGDELFVRSAKGMRPTAKAQELSEPIARMLAILYEEVLQPSSFLPEQSRRSFVINTTDIGEMVFLPPLLRKIRESAPHVVVECICLDAASLIQAMRDGAVDLALGYMPDLTTKAVYTQSLFKHPFVCMLRQGHPGLEAGLTMEAYRQAEHISLVGDGHGQRKFEDWIANEGIHRRIAVRSRHFMHIPFIVRDTDLIATVPKVVAVSFMASAGLCAVDPPFNIPAIPIKQYWSERQHRDPGHMWLRRMVADLFLNKDPTVSKRFDRLVFMPV
ncbi:LysR family transcriptional regulator [Variovorax sp. RT4R15]|uniref:LysR family transcriptional regulator n=1 Tax=Variovorax sp. RT4R15 TaxID=3443737 RepID=UPI003F473F3C